MPSLCEFIGSPCVPDDPLAGGWSSCEAEALRVSIEEGNFGATTTHIRPQILTFAIYLRVTHIRPENV